MARYDNLTPEEAQKLLQTEEDFVYSRRFNFSLEELKRRHPDEAPERITAAVLMLTEDEVKQFYDRVVAKLRAKMAPGDSL